MFASKRAAEYRAIELHMILDLGVLEKINKNDTGGI